MNGIKNTTTENFADLIGNNRKFSVPVFQRNYSWDEEQWDDLWQDIMAMIDERGDHYMVYLVLQSNEDDPTHFKIIDGQQRFTTLTLLILATLKVIHNLIEQDVEKESNKKRFDSLMSLYIGRQDPVSLEYDNILELNRNNNSYYKDYIVKLANLRSRGLTASNKLLKKCFEWLYSRISDQKMDGTKCAEFIQYVVNNLFFTVIIVNDDMNAFRVFETLNARGVQLSSADLLKNYLFSIVDDGESSQRINDLEHSWNELSQNVRTERLPDFIRYYWNACHKYVRSAELFKTIRKQIKTATDVFNMVREMREYSDIYMALKSYTDETWADHPDIAANIELLSLFGLRQPYSLLMTAYVHLSLESFSKVLRSVIMVCFRYNVICGKNPNEIEKAFNDMALTVTSANGPDFHILQRVYIQDMEFENAFASKSFPINSRNTKVIRYILGKIEQVVSGNQMIDIHDDFNSIEHIMPQNPGEEWNIDEFKAEQLENRLGNLCLLSRSDNREIGNLVYTDKIDTYKKSTFATTRAIPDHYTVWDENSINSRQKQMARLAKGIWKL